MTERATLPYDGETALVAPVDDGLALIAGIGELPTAVTALLNGDPSAAVEAAAMCWRRPEAPQEARSGFVALVPLAALGRGRLSAILFRRPGHPTRYALPHRPLPLEALLQAIAADAGPGIVAVVDGIIEALLAGQPNARRLRAVASMAQAVAQRDGFVEVVGPVEGNELFLQGWTADLVPGRARVIAMLTEPVFAELESASFPREDLAGRGRGFCGLLTAPQPLDITRLQRLLFRGREGWRSIAVYERALALNPRDVPAHVRAEIPRLTAPAEVLARLKATGNRFDGRDTVADLKVPVRLGIDFALVVEGGGVLVSGWMLDVERRVEAVTLRVGTQAVRLDETWTRRPRPDVTKAYQGDAMFAGLGAGHQSHGFLAFAPSLPADREAGDVTYLELTLGHGPAYRPLTVARCSPRQIMARLTASLEPKALTSPHLVERHLGPMAQAISRPAPRAVPAGDVGAFTDDAQPALVVGVDGAPDQAGALISLLALDPETRGLPIIVSACEACFDEVAADVQRLADFYGLNLRLVCAEGAEDVCDALEAGVRATKVEHVVLLAGDVLPRANGWFGRLERAYRARGGKCLAAPTLLFEDDSVRWAGTVMEGEGSERSLVDRHVGYPRAVLDGAAPDEVAAGAVQCCMLPRAAFEGVGGFSRNYIGVAEKGLDLALKLRLAGTPSVWVPTVEMMCADEAGANLPWLPLARRIDRWAFDRRWTLAVSNMRS